MEIKVRERVSGGFQYLSEFSAPSMRPLENPNTELYVIIYSEDI